jgi:hypothetical protein
MSDVSELSRQFDRDGFLHLKNVFDADQATQLRSAAATVCAEPQGGPNDTDSDPHFGTSRSDVMTRFPALRWILWHAPLRDALHSVLGNPVVVVPECALHMNFFSTWHQDSNSPRRDGQHFYLRPSFKMLQAAIYLQNNSVEFGGGLDVMPQSHRDVRFDRYEDWLLRKRADMPNLPAFARNMMTRAAYAPRHLCGRRAVRTVPISVGDVVLFDIRIFHRATPPRPGAERSTDKYAIFLLCSADNQTVDEYLTYIRDVRKYEYLKVRALDPAFSREASQAGYRVL